ncbi:hypothetical protein MNEG_13804 [Monoraphidium neglectum]|uniref:Uncharacterized protein n=1 Tax=Monoraphidium neglectum TaxID=145388 RepID=A0A0D2J2J9_9CHLO|nr:hypothetical protein MNEG_13804 [Monoraphidium neglectum]KIY94157.1 hypothetical protein MNEG_13804 [Monoraphidium neglectum]|eukprot:XP_013893177.1 hypothetical protein MNEG_13804 [Monoraphidium neglectum]
MTRLSLVAGVFVALLACASPRAVKGRSLLQEPDVPFDPAAVAALDSRAVIIAGAGSPATARPNCRDFSSVAYVEAFNPATSSPSYPIVYPRPFTSLDFHFSATNAATNEKLDVHPKFTADISTFSFLLSDGSSAPTYDLTSKVLPVGWRCTFKVDPASVPSGLAPKQVSARPVVAWSPRWT